jgi:hypothetical protein
VELSVPPDCHGNPFRPMFQNIFHAHVMKKTPSQILGFKVAMNFFPKG